MKKRLYLTEIILIIFLTLGAISCSKSTNDQASQPVAPTTKPTANSWIANTNTTNSVSNAVKAIPQDKPTAEIKNNNDVIMNNLHEAIYSWSPEQEFSVSTELKHIWVKGGNHPWEYSSKGAKKLINNIQANNYFKTCQQARELKPKMFEPNGEIQTIGHLYNELYYCHQN